MQRIKIYAANLRPLLGFRVYRAWVRVSGLGIRVQGFRFRAWGLGFPV